MAKTPRRVPIRPAESVRDSAAHPLSVKRTGLVWEGKYGTDGKRVAPLRVTLPFQTVEMVNKTTQKRQKSLLLESPVQYHAKEWRNLLARGDKEL